MSSPDNFHPVDHLRDAIYRVYRREVSEWFQDIDFDHLDLDISRHNIARACRPNVTDTLLVALSRMLLFETVRGRFAERLAGGSGETGVTRLKQHVLRKSKPQVVLYFLEDANDVAEGYAPVDARISFRLMDYSTDTITPAIAHTIAQRVKTNFMTGGGFVWKKGREMASYTHWEKGYQLQLLVRNESEGRRVVEQVLDLQNDAPDWEFFNFQTNAEPAAAYPTIPDVDYVYGESRRMPRRRPVADVRFQYAALNVEGVAHPIVLADRTGVLPNALIQ